MIALSPRMAPTNTMPRLAGARYATGYRRHDCRHHGALVGFVVIVCALAILLLAPRAQAGMAERAKRLQVAGIDVIVYPTAVKDVVTIRGALPAGTAFAGQDNSVAPALVGMTSRLYGIGSCRELVAC